MKLLRKRGRFMIWPFVLFVYFITSGTWKYDEISSEGSYTVSNRHIDIKASVYQNGHGVHSGRHLLQTDDSNCTPRSIEQFPPDFMTEEQRRNGGVVVHILISLYIFAALAIVCDDYFVSSLERICEALQLQPDVAGATFMAAGSSAPELFTSIIGVFFAKSDVGVGTIVGSAVFNLLFIIALCALFSGMIIHLTWWPMFRDLVFYTFSVAALVAGMADGKIYWYESTIMVCMYILYCVVMYFNPAIGDYAISKVELWKSKWKSGKRGVETAEEKDPLLGNANQAYSSKSEHAFANSNYVPSPNVEVANETDFQDASHSSRRSVHSFPDSRRSSQHSNILVTSTKLDPNPEYSSPLTFPQSVGGRMWWILMLPAILVLYLTIPDCRRPGCWRRVYMATFFASIIWLAGMSYVTVWMVTIAGDTLGIPDEVMGLTFLAAGTSIPDALSSLFVSRDGYGDMAVSNSIGSNVFDILIGLGLPWLIQTGMVEPNSIIDINSAGLSFSAIMLLATVVLLIIAIVVNKWRLTKPLGFGLLLVYVVVVAFSCMYVLNVFGFVTLPSCPRSS